MGASPVYQFSSPATKAKGAEKIARAKGLSYHSTPEGGVKSDGGDGSTDTLNPCLLCDELHCSPTFMRVGGANRRSGGVETDIRRRDGEVCALGASPAEVIAAGKAARAAAAAAGGQGVADELHVADGLA